MPDSIVSNTGSDDLRSLVRWQALLATLKTGPLPRPTLIEQLGAAYPPEPSARPMIDRDVRRLRSIGIVIEITSTRPPVYTLLGGTPVFTLEQLRTLSLIRDTFSARHPQARAVASLLDRLTATLSSEQQALYAQRQTQHVPLDPAIDYTPFSALFDRLNQAISAREVVRFAYQSTSRATPTLHRHVEPYDIEYHDRHFYLVAYSEQVRQVLDFRIDRIDAASLSGGMRLPPGLQHVASTITFRYRLAAALARGAISERFMVQHIIERLPNGDVIIEAEGRNEFVIVQTLLRYGNRAELLWPPSLRARMVSEVVNLMQVYQGRADDSG